MLTDALIGTFAAADDPDLRQNRCFLYHVIGGGTGDWDVPVGGMGAVTAALRDAALAAGAELRTGAEVTAVGDGEVRFARPPTAPSRRSARAGRSRTSRRPSSTACAAARPREPPAEGVAAEGQPPARRACRACATPQSPPARAFAGTFHVNETAAQLRARVRRGRGRADPGAAPCEAYCHTLSDPSILGAAARRRGRAHDDGLRAAHAGAALRRRPRRPRATPRSRPRCARSTRCSPSRSPTASCADAGGEPCIDVHTPADLERELRLPRGNIFHGDLAWPFAEDDATSAAGASRPTTRRSSSAAPARAEAAAL